MKGLMKLSAETTLAALQKKNAASALVAITRRTVDPLIVCHLMRAECKNQPDSTDVNYNSFSQCLLLSLWLERVSIWIRVVCSGHE